MIRLLINQSYPDFLNTFGCVQGAQPDEPCLEKTVDTIRFVSALLEESYQVRYNPSSMKGLGGPELMKIMFEKRLFPILITV